MCGRYVIDSTGRRRWISFLDEKGQMLPLWMRERLVQLAQERGQYDIRPTQIVPVVTAAADDLVPMQWWFVPAWAPDATAWRKKATTFNARVEGVADSRTYRNAWRAGRRCLLPMTGYYEWRALDARGKTKERNYIAPADGRVLWAAGLWETWQRGEMPPLHSVTMITRDAHPALAYIHDRSPLFVPDELAEDWLRAGVDAAAALLHALELPELQPVVVTAPIEPASD